ncbi:MAG TPA: hypothetical protein VF506_17455 [Streptosporangiaceae bacterium]
MTAPQPGDFAVVTAGGIPGQLVRLAELANGSGPWSDYQHAFIYIGDEPGASGLIIQAEPAGARYAQLTPHAKTLWSTGRFDLTGEQRDKICDAARGYIGTPYSFLDYVALVLHRLHIPVPWLKRYIASTRHLICSQLVDQCYLEAGVHLFSDGRWPGEVIPADLAWMLVKLGAVPVEGT